MRHVLVVANRTLGGEELLRVVLEKASAEPTDFWLVVPATLLTSGRPNSTMDVSERMRLDFGGTRAAEDDQVSYEAARDRLRLGIERFGQAGITVDGEVGDPDPQRAVKEALARYKAHEIIVSTLPTGVSHWLRLDLPKRLERKHHVPVTTVTAPPAHR